MKFKFIIGPSNSGKSIKIERELELKEGKSLYFGTISDLLTDSKKIINRHKERRMQDKWIMYEITKNYSTDFRNIRRIILKECPNVFLLDGVWNMFLSYGNDWSDYNSIFDEFSVFLEDITPKIETILIDSQFEVGDNEHKQLVQNQLIKLNQ